MLEKIYDLLSSLKLAVALLITGAVYEIFLTAWAATSSAEKVAKIGKMSPFVILWALLLLNIVLCIIRRLSAYLKNGAFGAGSVLLHGAVLVIACAMLLSHLFKFEGKFTLGLHEEREIGRNDYEKAVSNAFFNVEPPSFRIGTRAIDTRFWGDELLFTKLTSIIRLDGKEHEVAINDPLFVSPFTAVRVSSFGYGLTYIVAVEDIRIPVEEKAVKLNIFPPGQTDAFRLDSFPHRFYVSLFPDYIDKKGIPSSKSMRLDNPRLEVDYYRGKVFLGRALVAPGDRIDIEQFSFSIISILPTAEYSVVYDPGFPVLMAGFLLGIAGFFMRLIGKKGEPA